MATRHKRQKRISFSESSHRVSIQRTKARHTPPELTPYPESASSCQQVNPLSHFTDIEGTWYKKTALTIDGGGLRCHSSLLILQTLMKEIESIELASVTPVISSKDWAGQEHKGGDSEYRPCHYFDYIVGSDSGGIIAVMLGRNRMTVDEAISDYQQYCVESLGDRTPEMGPGFFSSPGPEDFGDDPKRDPISCRAIAYTTHWLGGDKCHEGTCYRSFSPSPSLEDFVLDLMPGHPQYFFEKSVDATEQSGNASLLVVDEIGMLARGLPDVKEAIDCVISVGGAYSIEAVPESFATSTVLQEHVQDAVKANHQVMQEKSWALLFKLSKFGRLPHPSPPGNEYTNWDSQGGRGHTSTPGRKNTVPWERHG